jgi:chromosome segregation ATPase
MQDLIERWLSEGVTGLIAASLTWFFSRRQQAATTEMLELDLTDRAITIWRNQSENLWLEVNRIRTDLDAVTKENEALRKEVDRLRRENEVLKKRLNKYENTQNELNDAGK